MDAIKDKKTNDTLEPHNLTWNLPIEEYIEGLDVYRGSKIGAMNCPMSLVTRANAIVPAADPEMAPNQPYSIEHGSIIQKMIQSYSHYHTLYATDNTTVYDELDTALRVTKYHATIAPSRRRRDGRGAYLALTAQLCGPALWNKIF